MGRRKILTDDALMQLGKLFASGLTEQEIALAMGWTARRVERGRLRLGLHRTRVLPPVDWRAIIERMGRGETFKDACAHVGSDRHRVEKLIVKGRSGHPEFAEFAAMYDALREAQASATAERMAADPLGHRRSVQRVREKRRRLREESRGVVYFIHAPSVARVKIGFTSLDREIRMRLSALQTGSPVPLVLLGCADATLEHERRAHRAWHQQHSHGEWFDCSANLMDFIERALCGGIEAALMMAPRPVTGGVGRMKLTSSQAGEIRERVARGESNWHVARLYRVSPRLVRKICRGEIWKEASPCRD